MWLFHGRQRLRNNKIDTLDQDIHSLENSHLNSDFTATEALLDKLISYLNAQLGKPKSYKTEFNLETAQKDTTLQEMLMYGKEASNRKQEIDRQHYTIPNQRPKDKHCGKI